MQYTKKIEITDTGMVVAEVFDENGIRKGIGFFSQLISTTNAVEGSCKKAHAWADRRIEICIQQETD